MFNANKTHIYKYPKARNVARAKNKVLENIIKYKKEYPAILFMDADDEMCLERPKMLDTAIKHNSPYVLGGWERKPKGFEYPPDMKHLKDKKKRFVHSAILTHKRMNYGPWATLFHHSLITSQIEKNGCFFFEGFPIYEDLLTFHHLKHIEKIKPSFHESEHPVHFYHENHGSCSLRYTKPQKAALHKHYLKIVDKIKEGVNIFKDSWSVEPTEPHS